ncbi:hypothetical protein ACUNWD_11375 [Sunxiuqinia sp. A32]|uniref:hypothetical protein n=1 Tax=Sunxiuqinia sp. A32 TaxID=3461496 RepID=UPI004045F368
MSDKNLKILFYGLAVAMLIGLLFISRDAGISGDEEVHYIHSEKVFDYFATLGKDQDALHTPKTHLQYYGQSPDNIATILIHWFGIEDIYGFRHLFSSFLGWLAIFVTALFASWLKGFRAGILVLVLFAISPRFLGHLQNNLKDIPFALAYIAGVFYTLKLTYAKFKPQSSLSISILIASIAFSVSIRAGGILLVFYLLLAGLLFMFFNYYEKRNFEWRYAQKLLTRLLVISFMGYLLGLLLWPYALQNPIINPWRSYQVMTHFPTTLRQIFEGEFIWSDFHPWHYLPKYMLITIPLIVFLGILFFILFIKKIVKKEHRVTYTLLLFSVLFPPIYVITLKANLYGGWRHLLFIYPGIIILSAIGLNEVFKRTKRRTLGIAFSILLALMMINPVSFMVKSHPYYYLYYNQLVGGLKGAYTHYETDYYYHTMRSGAEWLVNYLDENKIRKPIKVAGNFPASAYFKNKPNIQYSYVPYLTRQDKNWDYAIFANSYINPQLLKDKTFPPEGTIQQIDVDGVPVCAVVKRKSKEGYLGFRDFINEEYLSASEHYKDALTFYHNDGHLYYRLAKCLYLQREKEEALRVVVQALQVNPTYEPALKLAGTIEFENGNVQFAKDYFEKLIVVNKKYFSAYVELAKIYFPENPNKARDLLKSALKINPRYRPAIEALAETYQETHPEIVDKYREYLNTIRY